MNMKAALYEPAEKIAKRGRRRKKGDRLPSPLQMAQNKKAKWIKTTLTLYGKQVKLWYQTIDALWYPSAGQQLLRIVVVRDPSGRRRDDCFFSLDLTLSATQILEIFSRRWPLEVCFRDVKQFLGFEDPQNRVARLPCTGKAASPARLVLFAAARARVSPARRQGGGCARWRGFETGAGR